MFAGLCSLWRAAHGAVRLPRAQLHGLAEPEVGQLQLLLPVPRRCVARRRAAAARRACDGLRGGGGGGGGIDGGVCRRLAAGDASPRAAAAAAATRTAPHMSVPNRRPADQKMLHDDVQQSMYDNLCTGTWRTRVWQGKHHAVSLIEIPNVSVSRP
jgi:hypothetical protein